MSLITSSIPNLINGVSQQPYILRLSSQAEAQVNAVSSVVEGLKKRPPTKFQFMVGDTSFASSKILSHQINRDTSERYQVLISNTGIKVFDLITKTEKLVTYKDSAKAYLACNRPVTELRALTVADYTFILNRTKVAASLPTKVAAQRPAGLLWVRQGAYGSEYKVILDNTLLSFKTAGRSADSDQWNSGWRYETEDQQQAVMPAGYTATPPRELPKVLTPKHAATDYIAGKLYDLLRNHPTLKLKFQFTLQGSAIRIQSIGVTTSKGTTYPDFTLNATDSQGDTVLKSYKDKTQNFTDLPAKCFNGFRLKVMGDGATEFDDYYVRYEGTATGGVWVEDIADDETYMLDPSTLPHALIRKADGTFSFEALTWEPRKVGDAKSNPLPSFLNKKIQDMFFFRNRFGLVAQEQVVMSRFSDFFNFFRASATQILDTDPIDVAVSHVKISDINHAVAYNETLLLWAQGTQFQIGKADLLTPKTISFNQCTEFDCSARVKPIGLGQYVYFVHDRGEYSAVHEYYIDKENVANNSTDVTSHVPKYIPGDIDFLSASSQENVILALSNIEKNVVYTYQHFWSGDDKIQSSWSKWVFDKNCDILTADFIESTLWLTVLRDGYITMETMNLAPYLDEVGSPYVVHLDRRLEETNVIVTYNSVTDQTTIKLPYPYVPGMKLIAKLGNPTRDQLMPGKALFRGYVQGEDVDFTVAADGITLIVSYQIALFHLGVPYEFRYRFSPIVIRTTTENGASKAVTDGRLQLRTMTLEHANSGYYRVEVTPERRETYTYRMTAKTLGLVNNRVNRNVLETGQFKFPVMSKNDRVSIDIVNDSPMPCSILSAAWEGLYNTRAKRI